MCQRSSNHKLKAIHNYQPRNPMTSTVCQRSSNHKLKAIHNKWVMLFHNCSGVSKIVKSQIEHSPQLFTGVLSRTTVVCQRSSNHKLKAIHNRIVLLLRRSFGVSKIVKSQIESTTTAKEPILEIYMVCQRSSNHKLKAIHNLAGSFFIKYTIWCVKDRQITN